MTNKDKAQKEINIVHQNAIWRETIKKEAEGEALHTNYSINPHRLGKMNSVTEKPGAVRIEGLQDDPEFLDIIDRAAMEPHKKYLAPLTEAQEIGWFHEQLIESDSSDTRQRKPRTNSEITTYMDAAWRLKEQTENLQ